MSPGPPYSMKRVNYCSVIFVLCAHCIFISNPLNGQGRICVDSSKAPAYSITNYQVDDGLVQNTIKDMDIDGAGFVWISTETGINQFNGNSIKTYKRFSFQSDYRYSYIARRGDTLLFAGHPEIFVLDGRLIAGKKDLGSRLIISTNETFPKLKARKLFGQELLPWDIFYARLDSARFYIGYRGYFDYRPEIENLRLFRNETEIGIIPETNRALADATIAIHRDLLFVFDRGVLKCYRGETKLHEYDLGLIGSDWTFFQDPQSKEVFLHSVSLGDLFQLRLNGRGLCLQRVLKGFKYKLLSILTLDSDNHYLLGSANNGLFELRKHAFNTLYVPQEPNKNAVYRALSVGRDSFLVESNQILTPGKMFPIEEDDSTRLLKVLTKARGPFSVYLFKSHRLLFKPKGFGYGRPLRSPPAPWPTDQNQVMDKDGQVWMAIEDTLYKLIDSGWEKVPLDTPVSQGHHLYYDELNNRIWYTRFDGGVYHYIPNDSSAKRVHGLPRDHIYQVLPLTRELTLVNFEHLGFYLYSENKVLPIPSDPKNYLQFAHCAVEDEGFLWISTNNGLFKVLKQDLISYFKDPEQRQVYYECYNSKWGFLNSEFNSRGLPCGSKIPDGRIAFPSMGGMVVFDPKAVGQSRHGEKLVISQLKIDGKDTTIESLRKLEQNYREIRFSISHANFGSPNNHYLQYRLGGYHKDWLPLPIDQDLSFQRLSHGSYTLEVRKLIGHGSDNIVALNIPIVVQKLYYETVWFKITAVMGILLIFTGILIVRNRRSIQKRKALQLIIDNKTMEYKLLNEELKLKMSQLRRSEKEQRKNIKLKEKMMAIYTHDIRGPLRFIASLAKNSSIALDKIDKEQIDYYFKTIEQASMKVFDQTEHMFHLSNMRNDDFELKLRPLKIYDVAETCIHEFRPMASEKSTQLVNRIGRDIEVIAEKNALHIIITNVLQNSIKYTSNGSIQFESYEMAKFTVLRVADSGVGMGDEVIEQIRKGTPISKKGTENENGKGFGLSMVNDFLRKMGGYMEIESTVGKGTILSLYFRKKLQDQ